MPRLIKLDEIQKNTKKFYETCSDISILQRELDEMLVAIEKNAADFGKGKISKDIFTYNEERMKKESATMIKKINNLVETGVSLIDKVNKEVETQKVEVGEKKKDRIKEIKKKMVKKRTKKIKPDIKKAKKIAKKKNKVAETPKIAENTASEQKVEQGS